MQEDCLLSDPQGDSDADADIEDTDCRYDEDKHTLTGLFTHIAWLVEVYFFFGVLNWCFIGLGFRSPILCSESARGDANALEWHAKTPQRAKMMVGGATDPTAGIFGSVLTEHKAGPYWR